MSRSDTVNTVVLRPAGPGDVGSVGSAEADRIVDLRATAREALRFQREFLRRKWATYYAAWAIAVAFYFVVPELLGFTPVANLPTGSQIFVVGGLIVATTLLAVIASFRLWGLVERSFDLRQATFGTRLGIGRENLLRFGIIIALLIGVIALATRWSFGAYLIVDSILVVVCIFLLRHLGRAFHPIPIEGKVAFATYLAAAGISYVALIVLNTPAVHFWVWSAAILVWGGCAGYARFHGDPAGGGP
jgi:hypothetical protein